MLPKDLSKILDTTFRLREKADYDDFVFVSADMAEEQLTKANTVIEKMTAYLNSRWQS